MALSVIEILYLLDTEVLSYKEVQSYHEVHIQFHMKLLLLWRRRGAHGRAVDKNTNAFSTPLLFNFYWVPTIIFLHATRFKVHFGVFRSSVRQ